MTPWHDRYIAEFVSQDLPPGAGKTMGEASRKILELDARGTLPCGALADETRASLQVVASTPSLSELQILEYINKNDTNGFVAYALGAPDGSVRVAFRGSERRGCNVVNSIDWIDNFAAPFMGSVQYPDVAAIASRYPTGDVTFTGHSKGGHNALYALASSPNPAARAVAFNGQGFPTDLLTQDQTATLKRRGVNYVVESDVVGALMKHPEKRTFVKKSGDNNSHALSSFTFDEDGDPVPGRRPLWSYLIELASRLYLRNYTYPQPAPAPA